MPEPQHPSPTPLNTIPTKLNPLNPTQLSHLYENLSTMVLYGYHTYPTQYAANWMVAYCVGRVHNMLLNGAHCVGSILWLNRPHCHSTMHPISTYSSHDVRKRKHRIHWMHKQTEWCKVWTVPVFLSEVYCFYIGKFLDEIVTEEYSLSNQPSEL